MNDFLDRAVAVYPERVAIVDEPDRPATPMPTITYGELGDVKGQMGVAMDEMGDRVAMVSHNSARTQRGGQHMCRNITTLRGLEPTATDQEIEAGARQYVRKITGVQKTSAATEDAFEKAVAIITEATREVLADLPPRKVPPKTVPPLRTRLTLTNPHNKGSDPALWGRLGVARNVEHFVEVKFCF